MRTRVAASIWAVFMVLAPLAQGAEPTRPAAEMERLRTENKALREIVKRFAKENTELKAELQRLKGGSDKAEMDPAEAPLIKPPLDQMTPPATEDGQDSNAAVVEAIVKYISAVNAITSSADMTDIQKRQAWLEESRNLDRILRESEVTISYTLSDVSVSATEGCAVLWLSLFR